MYKKITLVLLSSFFFSSESFCSSNDPNQKIIECINYICVKIAENSSYIFEKLVENTKETRETIYKQITENSKEIIVAATAPVATAVCGSIVYCTNKTYEYLFPTPEQKASTEAARIQLVYLTAKTKFMECLQGAKPESARNSQGVPTDCEKTVQAFVACGGLNEAIEMSSNFGQKK